MAEHSVDQRTLRKLICLVTVTCDEKMSYLIELREAVYQLFEQSVLPKITEAAICGQQGGDQRSSKLDPFLVGLGVIKNQRLTRKRKVDISIYAYLCSPHVGKLSAERMIEREEPSSEFGNHECLFEAFRMQQRSLDDFHQDFVVPFVGILGVHNLDRVCMSVLARKRH